jgi:ParB family chromosome partitioning protein
VFGVKASSVAQFDPSCKAGLEGIAAQTLVVEASQAEVDGELLAHCVSLTANAARTRGCRAESEAHAAALAHGLSLDMTAYWQPTAASYFGRVSNERIVQAVREGVSDQAAENIARMKKQAMAEAADAALTGKGWLPALLRPVPDQVTA